MSDKPREWWVVDDISLKDTIGAMAYKDKSFAQGESVHVIEKSAYENERTKLACVLVNNGKLLTERDQALAERDEARERLAQFAKQDTELYPMSLYENLKGQIKALKAKNASLLDQLQWAHKNEKQYKDATQEALSELNEQAEWLSEARRDGIALTAEIQKLKESYKHEVYTQLCAENQRLREALEDMDYLATCSACLRNTEVVGKALESK